MLAWCHVWWHLESAFACYLIVLFLDCLQSDSLATPKAARALLHQGRGEVQTLVPLQSIKVLLGKQTDD